MNPHSLTLLVAAVFAAQILVVSFYCPWRLYSAWLELCRNYPPREFPRLYPIEPDKTTRLISIVQILNVFIGVVATAILAFNLVRGTEAHRLVGIMIFTYMAQFLPALLRVPLQIRMQRAFRSMPAPAVRSAELHHWRLTEFVSRTEIALGMAASILAVACSVYFFLHRDIYFHGPGNILPLLTYSAAISGLLLLRMLFLLSGSVTLRRPDPYMSEGDVIRSRRFRLALPFRMAILLGLYFIFMQFFAAGQLRLDFVYVMAGASILGQLLYLRFTHLSLRSLAARDLSAYRSDPGTATKEEAAAASS
jgi:hypothetical protein